MDVGMMMVFASYGWDELLRRGNPPRAASAYEDNQRRGLKLFAKEVVAGARSAQASAEVREAAE